MMGARSWEWLAWIMAVIAIIGVIFDRPDRMVDTAFLSSLIAMGVSCILDALSKAGKTE